MGVITARPPAGAKQGRGGDREGGRTVAAGGAAPTAAAIAGGSGGVVSTNKAAGEASEADAAIGFRAAGQTGSLAAGR